MSEQICVSIIIPFYNAEKHIENCFSTLLAQDFKKSFLNLILMAIKPNMFTKLCGNLVIDNSNTLIKLDCKTPFPLNKDWLVF